MKPLKQSLSHGAPTNLTQLTTKRSQLMYRHYLAEQYNTAEVCKPQKFRVLKSVIYEDSGLGELFRLEIISPMKHCLSLSIISVSRYKFTQDNL